MSWPFAVILGLPIAIDVVFRKRRIVFFVRYLLKTDSVDSVVVIGFTLKLKGRRFESLVWYVGKTSLSFH